MKHTKNWKVVNDSKVEITTERGLLICRISQFTPESIINREPERAKLIAAAPELLEALKKALPELKESLGQCGHDPSVGIDASELIYAIEEAEQAIKNAES